MQFEVEEEEEPEMMVEGVDDVNMSVEMQEIDAPMKDKADSDLELLENAPEVFKTPKKKAVKIREQLEDSLLRHSKRVSTSSKDSKTLKVPTSSRK